MEVEKLMSSVELCMDADLTPFIWGIHGIGKSSALEQLGEQLGVGVIDLRCANMESADLRGLPDRELNDDGTVSRTVYLPPADLPTYGKCSPACNMFRKNQGKMAGICAKRKEEAEVLKAEGKPFRNYCRGILFLDELNRANDDVLQGAFQLVWDKAVGTYAVPKEWKIVVAGNYSEGYMVNAFNDAAFLDRFVHIDLTPDNNYLGGWAAWMGNNHGDNANKILQFVGFNEENMFGKMDKKERVDRGFTVRPGPRSWASVAKIEAVCAKKSYPTDTKRSVISGLIGVHLAAAYEKFSAKVTPTQVIEQYEQVEKVIATLNRNELSGLTWGIISNSKKLGKRKSKKAEEQMNNVLNYMEHLALRTDACRDFAVVLGRQLCSESLGMFGGALMSNTELAQSIGDLSSKKSGICWLTLINERKKLQEIMKLVSYGE